MNIPASSLVLASASPRRRAYFSRFYPQALFVDPHIPEHILPGEAPSVFVRRVAREKCIAGIRQAPPGAVVVAADTIVVINNRILGKPANPADAIQMLRMLSGQQHQVETALHIQRGMEQDAERQTGLITTRVTFRELGEEEIAAYAATGEPMGKAGAYAIQGDAAHMVQRIRGSYTNVVGLPMAEMVKFLETFGFHPAFQGMGQEIG